MQTNGNAILVVDDEPKITDVICSYLQSRGYRTLAAGTGSQALMLAEREKIHLIILDLMLPDLSGEEVCRQIRETSRVPIIMLTAKVEENDMVNGLELGADDYVTKPFSLRALSARVEAVLRRSDTGDDRPAARIRLGDGELEIDLESRAVSRGGRPVALTPNEFKLLTAFARYPGKVFSREELIEISLGRDYDGFDRTVDSHIKNLRRKIERDPRHPRYIETVHGVGYRLGGGR